VPYRYDAARWQSVPKDFLENASACTLYSGATHLVDEDGTVETITHEITRLNGRKGVEKLGEYRNISYDPTYQKATLNEARVLKADGRVVPIEPKHVQLRDLGTDYFVFDPEKQLVISFPDLEVGDAMEVKWTTRGKNPEHQGQFFTRYNFGDDQYPVAQDEVRVRLPKGRTLKYGSVGGKLEPTIREEGAFRTFLWSTTNRRGLPRDENLPPKDELRWEMACSTFPSWEEVGNWKRRVRADCWQCTPAVAKVVQEVTKGLHAPVDKARALTYWVRRHVRYVSMGEKHDYTPHAPAYVLATRFGDCKDQSQLLAVMLKEAGLSVATATLGTQGDGQVLEGVPSPWGTHAILLVTIEGKDHWIDTTISQAPWDFLPRDDRGRLCYVVDDKNLRLLRTPPLTADGNRVEQVTHVSIGADGSAHCERASKYFGVAAISQRDEWTEVPPGERRRLATAELLNAYNRARLRSLVVDDRSLRDFDQPVTGRVVFDIPDLFEGDESRSGSLADNVIWNRILAQNLDYDRQTALDIGPPFESVHRYDLVLPAALVLLDAAPQDQKVTSQWGSFTLRVHADPVDERKLSLEFQTRLEKARILPKDFEAFRKFQEELTKAHRAFLSLKPTRALADALLLEAMTALAPSDRASAMVLAQLYQVNGRLPDARRVLQRACHYHPDDTALWELTVKTAADLKEEEAAYRELIRRFPNQGKYVVALGETLVNRGNQAGARKVLKPAAEKGPEGSRGEAHYQLARSYFQQNRAAEAWKHFETAAQLNPETTTSLVALQFKGQILEKLGRLKEAIIAFRLALALHSDSAQALGALARLELAESHPAEALDYLRRYTVVVGTDAQGLARAAGYHLRLQRYEDALELGVRSQKLEGSGEARRVIGLVYLHQGDYKQALSYLEHAGRDGQVLEGLIRANLALGKLEQARQQADRGAEIRPAEPPLTQAIALTRALVLRREAVRNEVKVPPGKDAICNRAIDHFVCAEQAHAEGRPPDQVQAILAACFEDGVTLAPALALRGLLALEKGNLTKALADADRAVTLAPKDARGYYVRGRVRHERGQEGAVTDLQQARELSSQRDAFILHWLAAALLHVGRCADAVAVQQQAVKLRPDDPELLEQLRQAGRAASNVKAGR
jgi:tetratricopeptide (TPR) repeat protein